MNFLILAVIFAVASFGAYLLPLYPCSTGLVEATRIPIGALLFVIIYVALDNVVSQYYAQEKDVPPLAIEDL